MILFQPDDDSEQEMMEDLWRIVKSGEVPDTIYVRFESGRYVRMRIEEWQDTVMEEKS